MITREEESLCPDCREPLRPSTAVGMFRGLVVCLCRWNGREPELQEVMQAGNLTTSMRQMEDGMAKIRAMTARRTLMDGGNGIYFFEKQTRKKASEPAVLHARLLVALCVAEEMRRLDDLRKRLMGSDDLCRTEQPLNSGKMT